MYNIDYSKSKTNEAGKIGEQLFCRHGHEVMKQFGYKKPEITNISDIREFWYSTDIDIFTQETDEEHAKEMIKAGLLPAQFGEVKRQESTFRKKDPQYPDKYPTGNIFIETKNGEGYSRRTKLLGIECRKRMGDGWDKWHKTGLTAAYWHFVLPIDEGDEKAIHPAALEAWRHDNTVPNDAFIITQAKPTNIIVSIVEAKLDELEEEYSKIEHYRKKEGFVIPLEDIMKEMYIWQPITAADNPNENYEKLSHISVPKTCVLYGEAWKYYAPYYSDADKAKHAEQAKEIAAQDKKNGISYFVPVVSTMGIFHAQKKNGEKTELALSGQPATNEKVYITADVRKVIESFCGMAQNWPHTCANIQHMIEYTRRRD